MVLAVVLRSSSHSPTESPTTIGFGRTRDDDVADAGTPERRPAADLVDVAHERNDLPAGARVDWPFVWMESVP